MSLHPSSHRPNKSGRSLTLLRAAHGAVEALERRQLLSGSGIPTTDLLDAVLREPDGDVVMAGHHSTFNGFDVVRFNPDATLDDSFGTGGHAAIEVVNMVPIDIVEDAAGNIYVAGTTSTGGTSDFTIVKLTPGGVVDTSFGTGGVQRVDFAGGADAVKQILMQDVTVNGVTGARLVVAGTTTSASDASDFALARMDLDGTADSSFGAGGKVTTDFGGGTTDVLNDVLADGSALIAGGSTGIGGYKTFALARYTLEGALDTGFGLAGLYTPSTESDLGSMDSEALSLASNGDNVLAIGSGGFFAGVAMLQVNKVSAAIDWNFGPAGQYVEPGVMNFSVVPSTVAGIGGGSVYVVGEWFSNSALLPGVVRYQISGGTVVRDLTYGGGIDLDGVAPADMGDSTIFRSTFSAHVSMDGQVLVGASADPTALSPDANFDAVLLSPDAASQVVYSVGFFQNVSTNQAPVVNPIEGPGSGIAGTTLNFSGSYSDPDDESAHQMAWTVSRSGSVVTTGAGPSFEWTPTEAGDYVVTFTVTDGGNLSGSSSLPVTITPAANNVAPVAGPIAGPDTALWGTPLVFAGSYSDPGDDAPHALAWTIASGSQVIAGGQGAALVWTAQAVGNYTITFTVTDSGGFSSSISKTVSVASAALNDGVLTVKGNASANNVSIWQNLGACIVRVDDQALQTFDAAQVQTLVIDAGDGDDQIILASSIVTDAEIHGGAGNDLITGGAGDDMLLGEGGNDVLMGRMGGDVFVGGEGNDVLVGGNGQDILIGGAGGDTIQGDNGSDILIAGPTSHDGNLSALSAIRAIWAGGGDYVSKVNTLTSGMLAPTSLQDDAATDLLSGDNGKDWILANTDSGVRDLLEGAAKNEIVTDLP